MFALELITVALALASVWLTVRRNMWLWPTVLAQVILSIPVYYHKRLYPDAILQVFFIVMQVYGWYHWARGHADLRDRLPITRLTAAATAGWAAVALAGGAAWGFVMHRYTDAALPYLDTTIATLSLAAQFLLSRKVLENWLFWIAVDLIAVPVYAARGLYAFSGLYAVFLILAATGLLQWLKTYRNQTTGPATASSSASSSPRTAATSS